MNNVTDNNVVFGPFVGDFRTEILTFLPYIRWIKESFNFDNVYISSHFNREFIYKDLYTEFIPIYKHLTRNELEQRKYLHKNISKKDFEGILKDLKSYSINQYYLPYTKHQNSISIFQKTFNFIHSNHIPDQKDYILYIPDKTCNINIIKHVYSHLKSKYNVIVVGDLRTHLLQENILVNQVDYIDLGYNRIIGYINNAKMVITPCSHWTTICNINKVPVFSWGDQVSPYKSGGNYHFDNKRCMTLPFTRSSDKNVLLRQIDYFINKNKGE